jgi:hypothetical protein
MKKNTLALFASEELIKDFSKLIALKPNQLKEFIDTFKQEGRLDFDDDEIKNYIEKHSCDISVFSSIASSAKYIFRFVLENRLNNEETKIELLKLAEKAEIKMTKEKLTLLNVLFKVSKDIQDEYAISPYIGSIIPRLQSCTSVFDLRAIYKDDEPKNITFIPVALIRILAEDDKDNKKSIEFQTDIKSLEKLYKYFGEYIEKLKEMEKISKKIRND